MLLCTTRHSRAQQGTTRPCYPPPCSSGALPVAIKLLHLSEHQVMPVCTGSLGEACQCEAQQRTTRLRYSSVAAQMHYNLQSHCRTLSLPVHIPTGRHDGTTDLEVHLNRAVTSSTSDPTRAVGSPTWTPVSMQHWLSCINSCVMSSAASIAF